MEREGAWRRAQRGLEYESPLEEVNACTHPATQRAAEALELDGAKAAEQLHPRDLELGHSK